MEAMTYICLLNWNGWQDTIGCIESLLSTKKQNFRIVVCDNDSSDGSIQKLEDWAKGMLSVDPPEHRYLKTLVRSERVQPLEIDYQIIPREHYEKHKEIPCDTTLTILLNEENLGFAGGNNRGIEYAMHQPDMTHLWLLNNDTLVEPNCLHEMHKRMNSAGAPAVVGSRVMFFDDPSIVQALGGNRFNPLSGTASQSIGRFMDVTDLPSSEEARGAIEQSLDYISGCSMLLPKSYLTQTGLMEESYFLYYEEIDWAVRSNRLAQSFPRLIAFDAVLYHKEGASIGSASLHGHASLQSEYYMFRSKFLFTRKHYPLLLPFVGGASVLQALNRIRQGRWDAAKQIFSLIWRVLFLRGTTA